MQGLEIFYVLFFLAGTLGALGLVLFSRRYDERRRLDRVMEAPEPPQLERQRAIKTSPIPISATPALPAMVDEPKSVTQLILTQTRTAGDRECPTCRRRYGETMLVCPFDATPLELVGLRSAETVRPSSDRPTCRQCGRRYESSARHCYHDGARLSTATRTDVPIVHACRSCGVERVDTIDSCGCDSPDIVRIDPSRTEVVLPTIPMMHCRRCDHVALPGTTHCEHDGELLFPVMNVAPNALPPAGIGPRRKVCPDCGRLFAAAAHYCSYDGTRLQHLN